MDDISEKDEKKENNIDVDSHSYLFYIKDKEGRELNFTYHHTYKEYYHLRCSDCNWKGTAKFNFINGKSQIFTNCSIEYKEHNYIIEKKINEKINNNQMTKEDI